MRIAIMGTGGVGGYLGARLAAAGQEVVFIARGAHLDALRERGLTLESPLGDALIRPVTASDDPAAVGPVDLVLFTVKLYDTEAAAQTCRPLLRPETGVVTFQNGVDSVPVLARILGRGHVVGGVAQISAVIAAPGVIRQAGFTPRFIVGEIDGRRSERIEALAAALASAGVDHAVSDAIEVDIWRKMVFLAALSGLTTLTRRPVGPIRSDPDTRALLADCMAEALAVARARGIRVPEDVADFMQRIDALPEAMRSSMLDDLERGRRLELPWLSGAIVRMGEEQGVPTPAHRFVACALKLHVNGAA